MYIIIINALFNFTYHSLLIILVCSKYVFSINGFEKNMAVLKYKIKILTKKLRYKHNSSYVNISPCWWLFAFLRSDKCLLNVYHCNIAVKTT